MPVEIRELVIKATVSQDGANGSSASSSGTANSNASPNEELINTCVEKILKILQEINGR